MSTFRPAATDPLKLWILTALAEGKWCLSPLGSRNADRIMNMDFPRVPRSDLLEATLELLDEGLIFVVARGHRVRPDRRRLSRWLFPGRWRRNEPFAGLTHAGGSIWEQACRAMWRRFVTNSMIHTTSTDEGDLADSTVVFEGSNEERIRFYSMAHAGPDRELRAFRWRRLAPWKATYWKTLPEGFRLTCDFKKGNYDPHRGKVTGPLWDLGNWYQDPPRVYDRGLRIALKPCDDRWKGL